MVEPWMTALAEAVLAGDAVAAYALVDALQERRGPAGEATGDWAAFCEVLTPVVAQALGRAGVASLDALVLLPRPGLLRLPGIGPGRADDIEYVLDDLGLSLPGREMWYGRAATHSDRFPQNRGAPLPPPRWESWGVVRVTRRNWFAAAPKQPPFRPAGRYRPYPSPDEEFGSWWVY